MNAAIDSMRGSPRAAVPMHGILSGTACRIMTACMVASLLAPAAASGQTVTWNVTTGTWSTAGSWLSGTVPATTDTAYFSGTSVGSNNVTALLSLNTTIGGLSFDSSGTTVIRSATTTTGTATPTLTLGTGGIAMSASSGEVTIGASGSAVYLILAGGQTWTNNSSNWSGW